MKSHDLLNTWFPVLFQWNSSGIPVDSCGFHWNSTGMTGFLQDSTGIPVDSTGIPLEWPDSCGFHRNSTGMTGFLQDSCRNRWGTVKYWWFSKVIYILIHILSVFCPNITFLGAFKRVFKGLQKTGLNRSRPVNVNWFFCGHYISKIKRPDHRSGLLRSWSGLVTVFFRSQDRTSKH